ncbi:MAG: nucleotidyltransferase domain-containing protein [Candidatus Colwellbacteria bacterium]|nr:nucleotidyltransferase domain-containing protein [Candidatus Colwellbacteria bacterium]
MPLTKEKKRAIGRAARFFRNVPFADSAILSGSCAMGTAKENSDIDVFVCARPRHIWTARFFTLLFADAVGIRNKGKNPKDKICLSLFISPGSYRLSGPESEYGERVYSSVCPLYGKESDLNVFFEENKDLLPPDFMEKRDFWSDMKKPFLIESIEKILNGGFGDRIELILRRIQTHRIERYLSGLKEGKMWIVLSDKRVETHYNVK